MQLATLLGSTETQVRQWRHDQAITPVFKRVDTCAAEFAAETPYMYSCYDEEDEASPTEARKVMMWANRNGYFYVLDRSDGEFLVGEPYVKVHQEEHTQPS